jgi:hypothetical protein
LAQLDDILNSSQKKIVVQLARLQKGGGC